jgi:hypothetical protein
MRCFFLQKNEDRGEDCQRDGPKNQYIHIFVNRKNDEIIDKPADFS